MVHGANELRRHGVEILRPRGEDEEGAFSASEEALTFGLLRDGVLLEVDEGEAGVDGNVLGTWQGGGCVLLIGLLMCRRDDMALTPQRYIFSSKTPK